jgi:hypothetical protein
LRKIDNLDLRPELPKEHWDWPVAPKFSRQLPPGDYQVKISNIMDHRALMLVLKQINHVERMTRD